MRGISAIFYDQSIVEPQKGVLIRGYTLSELKQKLPKRKKDSNNDQEPLPEGIFFLLLTGQIPTFEQVEQVRQEWDERGEISDELQKFIQSLDNDLHPMTMLSLIILHEQRKSKFSCLYQDQKLHKENYWEYVYEDSVDLISKLPRIASIIYRKKYKKEIICQNYGIGFDWAEQMAFMMGFEDNYVVNECFRAFLSLHSDHEGGEVSTHASQLVGSALGDPYLALSSAYNGLAGPLHGLANQEVLKWILQFAQQYGYNPTDQQIEYVVDFNIKNGRVIPGYGHTVLRVTDPRFTRFQEFSQLYLKDNEMIKLVHQFSIVIPQCLKKYKNINNPYPNVDAHSGALLYSLGIKEFQFYTVIFAVSRSLGILSNLVWCRAYGLPILYPQSCDLNYLKQIFDKQ
ncbi:hypothetical protein IMG5_117920 [Ichthyophthirius multifiliis]|uniref:Citrate synthase n=1 Tax=Ichthyophthirius multifiliis TaxID=5932 RepID=G0QUM1_ICHMU|nr:hypothetical protein IMG5_117920 [Ichthyophthirius multifiliis]EGR31067.1 hypothetical protein IMG5_117920 [Ichthyophthirius multifiliis]|eukprot:XP_004034553.1 hypothetical protein IMG5_117920 [Ichthyophthirius multifiliis]